jgi:hypothetical protein
LGKDIKTGVLKFHIFPSKHQKIHFEKKYATKIGPGLSSDKFPRKLNFFEKFWKFLQKLRILILVTYFFRHIIIFWSPWKSTWYLLLSLPFTGNFFQSRARLFGNQVTNRCSIVWRKKSAFLVCPCLEVPFFHFLKNPYRLKIFKIFKILIFGFYFGKPFFFSESVRFRKFRTIWNYTISVPRQRTKFWLWSSRTLWKK